MKSNYFHFFYFNLKLNSIEIKASTIVLSWQTSVLHTNKSLHLFACTFQTFFQHFSEFPQIPLNLFHRKENIKKKQKKKRTYRSRKIPYKMVKLGKMHLIFKETPKTPEKIFLPRIIAKKRIKFMWPFASNFFVIMLLPHF